MFFVLIHDYTLCFTGSPCCNFGYYNYNDNDKVFYSTLIIHFIFNTAIDVFDY